jgi:hypothetical protein
MTSDNIILTRETPQMEILKFERQSSSRGA